MPAASIPKMSSVRPARHAGFSLLELALAAAVVAILAAVLLHRLNYYQETAEKVAMESTARLIKTGLQIHLAELIISNRQAEAASLEFEDPVQWLEQKPANYGGAYHDHARSAAWYFDERQRELVYVVNTGSRLELDTAAGHKRVRFRVRLLKDLVRLPGDSVERITGVALVAVIPYRWPE